MITANTTEPAATVALLKSASPSSYTSVLIQPSGGNFTINSAAAPTASRGIIELNGADNVTIDGDDPGTAGVQNLTILSAAVTTTGIACVRFSSNSTTGSDGCDNCTLRNCILIGSRSSATSTTTNYGFNMSNYSATSMTTGAYSSLNTVVQNNIIKRCYHAIYANGSSVTYPNTGLQIINNIIGSSTAADNIGARGIFVSYSSVGTGAAVIRGNDVRVGDVSAGGAGYSLSIYGIEVSSANIGILIDRNNIHDIMQPSTSGYGSFGIGITSSTSNTSSTIQNNFIRDIIASKYSTSTGSSFVNYGIYISAAATGINIVHNTIALLVPNSTGSTGNYVSYGIGITSSTAVISKLLNNIIVNNNVGSGSTRHLYSRYRKY